MRLVSWNVNGIRASMEKGFREFVETESPDVICLQETKATPEQVTLDWADELGYHRLWNCAEKKGYSGTSIWSLEKPESHKLGIGKKDHDKEGRVITADMGDFQVVTVYTPNSQRGLKRLEYRQEWDTEFLKYLKKINKKKPVIFCGDLNVAHEEIDLANPKSNKKNAGFTTEEREGMTKILASGFKDSFREQNPEGDNYSWWTYRSNARERNIGWRLDYFCVAESLWGKVKESKIRSEIFGSDHCPVEIVLK
jgi:exodeoxyribonuclease-3